MKIEFHGSKVTSDTGLLAYRELDETLELFGSAPTPFQDKRTRRNIYHDIRSLRTLLVKLARIGSKTVHVSRYILFQMKGDFPFPMVFDKMSASSDSSDLARTDGALSGVERWIKPNQKFI